MARYDRHYDYGLRGSREAAEARERYRARSVQYDLYWGYPRQREPLPNRVTARYNMDYVFGGRGDDPYRRNYNMYGGDRIDRVGDLRYYRQPYTTIGGTHTFRGTPGPMGYDQDFDDYDRDFRTQF